MKSFILICLTGISLVAQQENQNLKTLIATEFAFAASAAEIGTRDAFLKFIADDGILFRPGPVNGKNFLSTAPKRPGLLSWYPAFAVISNDGDLGFTTGPADFRRDKDSAAIWFGNFCTIWQRQPNGEFKFVIDLGNSNEIPKKKLPPLKKELLENKLEKFNNKGTESNPKELFMIDEEFSKSNSNSSLAKVYKKYSDINSRILRDDSDLLLGNDEIQKYFAEKKIEYKFKPLGGKLSSSKDLGYVYGELIISGGEEKSNGNYNYMHAWKKRGKDWFLLVDVANRVQK